MSFCHGCSKETKCSNNVWYLKKNNRFVFIKDKLLMLSNKLHLQGCLAGYFLQQWTLKQEFNRIEIQV